MAAGQYGKAAWGEAALAHRRPTFAPVPIANNDILRRLRYALDLRDEAAADLFALGAQRALPKDVDEWTRREDDPAHVPMSDYALATFLNGLIVDRRGPAKVTPPPPPRPRPGPPTTTDCASSRSPPRSSPTKSLRPSRWPITKQAGTE